MVVTVLGDEPRPAVYLSGEDALRVGLTASERAELDRERWEATGAALTEEQRIVRDLTRAEIRRRKLHESEQERATALRELVLRALDAGISRWTWRTTRGCRGRGCIRSAMAAADPLKREKRPAQP